jgi:hypothetical protein
MRNHGAFSPFHSQGQGKLWSGLLKKAAEDIRRSAPKGASDFE